MRKSKFRPDANDIQSGWFNDRNGAPDRSIKVDGAMYKSAAEENSASRPEVAAQLGGGLAGLATDPASILKALQNGGTPPPEAPPTEQELDFTPSTMSSNPYVQSDVAQSGWFTKAQPKPGQDEEGLVDFDVLQAEALQKGDPCWDGYKKVPDKKDYEEGSCVKKGAIQPQDEDFEPNEEVEEDDDENEEVEKGAMKKHKGPASEDSTHPEVHNASDETGLDNVAQADKWKKKKKVQKSYGLDVMDEWLQKAAAPVQTDDAVEVLDTFVKGKMMSQIGPIGIQEHANARAAGTGSRGGKIVGRTKSGKPIYAKKPKTSPRTKSKSAPR